MLKIEQVDREAAAYCYLALEGPPYSPKDLAEAEAHQRGDYDAHEAVKAFAAHRIAAQTAFAAKLAEREAEVIERCAAMCVPVATCNGTGERPIERIIGEAIAAAIRATKDNT